MLKEIGGDIDGVSSPIVPLVGCDKGKKKQTKKNKKIGQILSRP